MRIEGTTEKAGTRGFRMGFLMLAFVVVLAVAGFVSGRAAVKTRRAVLTFLRLFPKHPPHLPPHPQSLFVIPPAPSIMHMNRGGVGRGGGAGKVWGGVPC